MAGSHAYVAWSDAAGPRLDAYSIGSYDASSIQNASAEKVNAMSAAEVTKTSDGSIQFTFFRPLAGVGGAPTIAPSAVSLTWAFGTSWHAAPASSDQHNDRSSLPTLVNLARPAAPTPYPSCSWLQVSPHAGASMTQAVCTDHWLCQCPATEKTCKGARCTCHHHVFGFCSPCSGCNFFSALPTCCSATRRKRHETELVQVSACRAAPEAPIIPAAMNRLALAACTVSLLSARSCCP